MIGDLENSKYYTAAQLDAWFGATEVTTAAAYANGTLQGTDAGTGPIFLGANVREWLNSGAPTGESQSAGGRRTPASPQPPRTEHRAGTMYGAPEDEELYTAAQVASYAGVTVGAVRQAVASRKLKGTETNDGLLIRGSDARQWRYDGCLTVAVPVQSRNTKQQRSVTMQSQSATRRWKEALVAKVNSGMDRMKAVRALAKEQPELHKAYIAEANAPTRQGVRR